MTESYTDSRLSTEVSRRTRTEILRCKRAITNGSPVSFWRRRIEAHAVALETQAKALRELLEEL